MSTFTCWLFALANFVFIVGPVATQFIQTTTPVNALPCPVPRILHGVVTHRDAEVPAGSTVVQGAIVYLTCEPGFFVTGGTNRSACVEIGWEPELGYCKAKSDDFSECGYRSSRFRSAYRPGIKHQTQPGEFPWMAKLEVEYMEIEGIAICAATLISRNWLLTSAHCLTRHPING